MSRYTVIFDYPYEVWTVLTDPEYVKQWTTTGRDADDVTDVRYRLEEVPSGTRFTWEHTGFTGVSGFAMSKLLGTVRRKMLTDGVPLVLAGYHESRQR